MAVTAGLEAVDPLSEFARVPEFRAIEFVDSHS